MGMGSTEGPRMEHADARRIGWLIEALQLQPHPEGGHYRRIHAATAQVLPQDGRGARPALTAIHYLLAAGETSRWHRVASDEVWHFIEGAPLAMFEADAAFAHVETRTLGPLAPGSMPLHVAQAGRWQAARSTGAYTLVACTVGPGFDFEDFELLRDRPEALARIRALGGEIAALA